jgi:hypothetical protein
MNSSTQEQSRKRLTRCLSVYEPTGDTLVSEHVLSGFDASIFSSRFGLDISNDPEMFNSYSVAQEHVGFLGRLLPNSVVFDFRRFAYFLETYTPENAA